MTEKNIPIFCASQSCPVDSEEISLRLQRVEDAGAVTAQHMDRLINKIDILVEGMTAMQILTSRVANTERDITDAFAQLRGVADRFSVSLERAVVEMKTNSSDQMKSANEWRAREFEPIKSEFQNWKGRAWMAIAAATLVFGLVQYIVLDKFTIINSLSAEIRTIQIDAAAAKLADRNAHLGK